MKSRCCRTSNKTKICSRILSIQKDNYQETGHRIRGRVNVVFAAAHSELHKCLIFKYSSKPRERKGKYFVSFVILFIAKIKIWSLENNVKLFKKIINWNKFSELYTNWLTVSVSLNPYSWANKTWVWKRCWALPLIPTQLTDFASATGTTTPSVDGRSQDHFSAEVPGMISQK